VPLPVTGTWPPLCEGRGGGGQEHIKGYWWEGGGAISRRG